MPFSRLTGNIIKFFKFVVMKPIQRFNIENRAVKYLGPESKYFKPAPRAIGASIERGYKGIEYPHLEETRGFKNVHQRDRQRIVGTDNDSTTTENIDPGDQFVRDTSNRLEVTKTIVKVDEPVKDQKTSNRPLPHSMNLGLEDPSAIWVVDKVPHGRLDLGKLQELMLNKLGQNDYWTPERVAEQYNIKPEHAESLMKYVKQIRIIVSPRMKKLMDYTGQNDPIYQSAKHLVYIVDKSLRNDVDKQYDDMYLPSDKLDEEVKSIIEPRDKKLQPAIWTYQMLVKKIEPLKIKPVNRIEPTEQKLLSEDKNENIKHLNESEDIKSDSNQEQRKEKSR